MRSVASPSYFVQRPNTDEEVIMYPMLEVQAAAIIEDQQQRAEHRRAANAVAGKRATRLAAKYRRSAQANKRSLTGNPATQSS